MKQLEEERQRSRWGEKIVNKNTELFEKVIRQPESPSATANTSVGRFTKARMKQRGKLKCKNQSEYKQTQPAVKDNMEKRGNKKKRYK